MVSFRLVIDGSDRGKQLLVKFFEEELKLNRGYGEVSGPLLGMLIKTLPDLLISKMLTRKEAENMLNDEIVEPKELNSFLELMKRKGTKQEVIDKFINAFYSREIGGAFHDKIAFGTKGVEIKK